MLATVTVTDADVVLRPAASRATAVTAWLPLATLDDDHVTEYGALVSSAPTATPSTRNWTPTTPMSSVALGGQRAPARTPSRRRPAR